MKRQKEKNEDKLPVLLAQGREAGSSELFPLCLCGEDWEEEGKEFSREGPEPPTHVTHDTWCQNEDLCHEGLSRVPVDGWQLHAPGSPPGTAAGTTCRQTSTPSDLGSARRVTAMGPREEPSVSPGSDVSCKEGSRLWTEGAGHHAPESAFLNSNQMRTWEAEPREEREEPLAPFRFRFRTARCQCDSPSQKVAGPQPSRGRDPANFFYKPSRQGPGHMCASQAVI